MVTRIQSRRDTTANWTSNNPVLLPGEFGIDLDSGTFRIGDGTTPYLSLPLSGGMGGSYLDHGSISGAQTFDGRIGTHAATLTAATAVTLSNGSNGATVSIWANGDGALTVEGTEVSTGECVAAFVRGAWEVRVIAPMTQRRPTAPTMDDTANTYTIPTSTGIDYKVAGAVVAAGTYSVGNVSTTKIITAEAQSGYSIVTGATTSWTFNFTYTPVWTTLYNETFTGADNTAINGKAVEGWAGKTWLRGGDGSATDVILSNAHSHTGAGNFGSTFIPNTAYTGPAQPPAVRYTADIVDLSVADSIHRVQFEVYYQSVYYGLYNLFLEYNGLGQFTGTGTGNDDAPLKNSFAALPGKSLTGNPTTNVSVMFEVIGTSVRGYLDGVQICTATLPGSLRKTSGKYGVVGSGTPSPGMVITRVKCEEGA